MSKLNGKIFSGYSSRCAACNAVMNDQRICFDENGNLDDLCSQCRHIVNKAIIHREEDIQNLPNEVWRAKLGDTDVFEDPERTYQGE